MADKKTQIIREDGKTFDIPPEGSLGLLALGAVALKPWREKRKEFEEAKKAKKEAAEKNKDLNQEKEETQNG